MVPTTPHAFFPEIKANAITTGIFCDNPMLLAYRGEVYGEDTASFPHIIESGRAKREISSSYQNRLTGTGPVESREAGSAIRANTKQ